MIDLTKNPYGKYNGKETEYVLQALNSDNPENKKKAWTQRFEEEFCRTIGVKYAIACNSGTSGLHAALVAADVGSGDEVISPALTVVMDAFATIQVGATPVFADINLDTMNIDPNDILKKITPQTKAIIVVSLYGLPVDMVPIMEIAKTNNLVVIEDSAQTVLGRYNGSIAGTLGNMGVFSFENTKHITCGSEGGMIVTNDENLAQKARKFAGIGYKHLTAAAGRTSLGIADVQNPNYERFDSLGLNYRMPEVNASIGLAQLERINDLVNRRQECAKYYNEAIEGCQWLVKQKVTEGSVHSYFTYAIKYYGYEKYGITWNEFYNKYKEMGGDGFYGAWKIPYLEPVFSDLEINGVRYKKGICSIAEEIQPRLMQFKTNYRNLEVAKQKVHILRKLIKEIESQNS